MYEFIFGFVAGALTSRFVVRKSRDAETQADDVVIQSSYSRPIPVPRAIKVLHK